MRTSWKYIGLILLLLLGVLSSKASEIELPNYIVQGIESEIFIPADLGKASDDEIQPIVLLNGEAIGYEITDNGYVIPFNIDSESSLEIKYGSSELKTKLSPIPIWLSIIPPLIAILLALIFKEVVTSLFLGIFFGAFILQFFQYSFIEAWIFAFLRTMDEFLLNALYDEGHLSVIVFSLLIGAMVSVISKNGGMQGIVNSLSKFAKNARSGQLATYFLGLAIFFDDYANTLVVGKTMRPVTDRLKISREKLAYLVDSTAAPIAAIALITTWIGAELGYISDGIEQIAAIEMAPYSIFLNSLTYSYYPILALVFIFIIVYKGRDFGPMLRAEQNARKDADKEVTAPDKEEEEKEVDAKANAWFALLPIGILLLGTIAGLFYTGYSPEVWSAETSLYQKISASIGRADSYLALLWGSAAALIAAIKISLFIGKQNLGTLIDQAIEGVKEMLPAIMILILAWSLAEVIEQLHTAEFLSQLLSDRLSPHFIPALTFILAALIAFSTGSSWGTMAILYPLILPLSWQVCELNGWEHAEALSIFFNTVSAVLAGSVLGDHCSPISDTTILSSLASDCNHISHVQTQMPYALTVGFVAVIIGTIPAAFGSPFWINFPLAIAVLWLIVHFFGKKVELEE
ncbi:MAG: sodium:proton antiporter [Flavobacteriales bacterium]|nr:sodium:proton antiporter [Flavobacteriales bacterium]